ncbi:zinc knuckle CX2CX4HX4C [Artemisia annua]|uniref:Zinc knuckle CX2CX4HX4C n=1 Tax=Artemisia annua TaxID=35608 RepID=A0A2U1KBC8_ARTAN|nr:zinc knuckle CX2CX4HX4C [Artemisia annua]
MEVTEPTSIPLWVKLVNVPMEAWTMKGLSSIASCLGKPIIMDAVTTSLCQTGSGRFGYARVLVEMSVEKEFLNEIEICYRDKDNITVGMKKVKVEYSWKPPVCKHCKVFGHDEVNCKITPVNVKQFIDRERQLNHKKIQNDGFNVVQRKNKENVKHNNQPAKKAYQPKEKLSVTVNAKKLNSSH